jgi:hypothetical protein
MNGKISFGAIAILIIGSALAWGIINMDKMKTTNIRRINPLISEANMAVDCSRKRILR